ncbi:MAG: HEAT repeat domain-containing protein [Planctomycetes bacterium]|nr:HEAT repeat domain-containing protein [Planctomycetota bacterium]
MRERILCLAAAIVLGCAPGLAGPDPAEEPEGPTEAEAFRELVDRFEAEKEKEPQDRIETIGRFEKFGTPECVAFLRGLYGTEKNEGIRAAVTRTLGKIGSEAAVQAIVDVGLPLLAEFDYTLQAAQDVLSKVRNSAGCYWIAKNALSSPSARSNKKILLLLLEVVGGIRLDDSARAIVGVLGHSDPEVVAAALAQVRRLRIESAAKTVARLAQSRNTDVQVQALMTLEDLDALQHRSLFLSALKSKAWEVRCIAVDILGKAKDPKLIRTIGRMFADPQWRVRAAVTRALGFIEKEESVLALIQGLQTETYNRVRDDIADTLARLTGKDLGVSGLDWESWWKTHRSEIEIRRRTAEEMAKIKSEQSDALTGVYYGLRVVSDFCSFVFDRSASMSEPYDVSASRVGAEGKRAGSTDAPAVDKKGGAGRRTVKLMKIEVAKAELRKVLRGMRNGVRFNLIPFNSVYRTWREALVPKDPRILEDAIGFVDGLQPMGMTNVYDTIVRAMSDREVDTIYFLSDGAPTAGTILDPKEIQRRIRELNRLKRIRIHTIGFHLKPNEEELMRGLAEDNDGIFVSR